jgi:hypothetical protein
MSCSTCQSASYFNPATIGKGIVGQVKSKLHINRASEETIKQRRDICRECPEATKSKDPKYEANKGLTSFSRCMKCLCPIVDKTNISTEQCPLGKW